MRDPMPSWSAFDLRTMLQGYFDRGLASTSTQVDRVTKLLGPHATQLRRLCVGNRCPLEVVIGIKHKKTEPRRTKCHLFHPPSLRTIPNAA